ATRVLEVETPTSREFERLDHDLAPGAANCFEGGVEIGRVQYHERSARLDLGCQAKSANFPASLLLDAGVFWPVVVELPAESLRVERFRRGHVGDGEFDVVDFVMNETIL